MVGSLVLNLALDTLFLGAALTAFFTVAVTWRAVGSKVLSLGGDLEKARRGPKFTYTITRYDGFCAKPQMPLMLIASDKVRVKSGLALNWPELRAAA